MSKILICSLIVTLAVSVACNKTEVNENMENLPTSSVNSEIEINDEFIKEKLSFLKANMEVDEIKKQLGEPNFSGGSGIETYSYLISENGVSYRLSLDVTNAYLNYATVSIVYSDNTTKNITLVESNPNSTPNILTVQE